LFNVNTIITNQTAGIEKGSVSAPVVSLRSEPFKINLRSFRPVIKSSIDQIKKPNNITHFDTVAEKGSINKAIIPSIIV
jgi:hypothetical protein